MPETTIAPLARVKPEWIDSNGHMNLAYYLVVFDLQTDAQWEGLGLGRPFRAQGLGTFCAETWVNYVREAHVGAPLACTSELLAFDAKRLLCVHRMVHAEEGWLVAENENLYLCMDLNIRRVAPWPAEQLALFAAQATGAAPRRLALGRRS